MKLLLRIIFAGAIAGGLLYFFWFKSKDSNSVISDTVTSEKVDMSSTMATEGSTMNYELIPRDEIYDDNDSLARATLQVIKERYKMYFESFVKDLRTSNIQVVFCWLTTEIGDSETKVQKVGKKYIKELCAANNVIFLDFSEIFMPYKPQDITYMPVDGHLREKGAELVANAMAKVIKQYTNSKSTQTFPDAGRPALFGDFEPNLDEIRDGGKNLPYRIKTNSQGLRMDYELTFPKKKQRVLLIGDSGFFFPFLDNDKTGTAKIQAIFPDKEIVNAANWGYSIDDYVTLWNERAKYIEPDIVLLQSTGDDIADQFFSHRLKYSRNKENIKPTDIEKAYYKHYSDMQMGK
ncbi:MAG: hypothetical protein K1X81_12000 [Bacteroidia bacterium]|nr:hypothetical protein [Bacteroidia bacterium]